MSERMAGLLGFMFWGGCGVLAAGIIIADFWYEFPILQDVPGRFRTLVRRSMFVALGGPVGLLVVLLMTTGARHGLMFRQPEEPK